MFIFIVFILIFLRLASHLSEYSKRTVSVFCVSACFSEYGCSWCTRRGQLTNSSVGCHLLPCFRQSFINCWAYQATASHFAPAAPELQMNRFMWVLGFELRSLHLSSEYNLSSSHYPGFKSMANNCTWRLGLPILFLFSGLPR